MIQVTRINGETYYINPDIIEYMDTAPGTILSLTTGKRLNILEKPEQVIERIVAYRRRIYCSVPPLLSDHEIGDNR